MSGEAAIRGLCLAAAGGAGPGSADAGAPGLRGSGAAGPGRAGAPGLRPASWSSGDPGVPGCRGAGTSRLLARHIWSHILVGQPQTLPNIGLTAAKIYFKKVDDGILMDLIFQYFLQDHMYFLAFFCTYKKKL